MCQLLHLLGKFQDVEKSLIFHHKIGLFKNVDIDFFKGLNPEPR